jgi:hypothetical protein
MRFRTKNLLAAIGIAAGLMSPAFAQDTFQPTANHGRRDPVPVYPSAPAESCPAPIPGVPGAMPSAPATPTLPGATPAPAVGPEAPVPGNMADAGPGPGAGAFGNAPSAGTGGGQTFNPTMFGDLLAPTRLVVSSSPRSFSSNSSSSSSSTPVRSVSIPVTSGGGFKISDNGSPRPQDRCYVTYNYFNDVGTAFNGPTGDVNRETIGFEKTFFDGNASLGARLPFTESAGALGGIGDGCIGDLTLYGTYAFLNDRQTGNVFSVGMALTIPTGPSFRDPSNGRDLNTWIYQPYIGYIWNFNNDFFVQAFHSAILSEHDNALSQDIGFGWNMYRGGDGFVRGITPTVELHLYTPLDNTSGPSPFATSTLISDNVLTVTSGVTVLLGERTTLGFAVAVPLTGPRPEQFEGIMTFNWRF